MYKKFLDIVKADLNVWCLHMRHKYGLLSFLFFFIQYPEFRVQFKTRLKLLEHGWLGAVKIIRYFLEFTVLHHNIFIYTEAERIGGGLMFHHGFSTMVSANSIGNGCHIYQQVTIGNGRGGCPVIGNNVTIFPGAKVFGGIIIGDDVIIGANCVVTKDIPSHSMIAGVPAKVIKYRKSENEEWVTI